MQDHFDFALGDDGAVRFTTKEGEPVMITEGEEEREASFSAGDVRKALIDHGGFNEIMRDTGVGGIGKPPASGSVGAVPTGTTRPRKVAPEFGVR